MKLTKAEILFTRKCPLSCQMCRMKRDMEELDATEWRKALGGLSAVEIPFLAIYGAEPLARFQLLLQFLEFAHELGFLTTVITSGLGLTDQRLKELHGAGLRSLTMSCDDLEVDHIADGSVRRKSSLARPWLRKWLELPDVRDAEAIVTVTRKNFYKLPRLIESFDREGIWTHFDIVHWERGNQGGKVPPKSEVAHLAIPRDMWAEFRKTMERVRLLKRDGKRIHPSEQAIAMFQRDEALELTWKCNPTSFLTVDADGSVWFCDDFMPRGVFPTFYAWDLPDAMPHMLERNRRAVKRCPGCFWNTHFDAEQVQAGQESLSDYVHE